MSTKKSVSVEKKNPTSDSSKETTVHPRSNARESQGILLIWLDSNINEKSGDYRQTMTEFRRVIDTVNTFTDGDECIQFIEGLHNEKAFMVISGSLGQHLIPRLHDMSQVESIFIFCGDKKRHGQWAKEWSKIKGVFTDIAPICEGLKQAVEQCKEKPVSTSVNAPSSSGVSFGNLDQLDPSFMYTQILREILLSIDFEQKHFQEFIQYCRELFAANMRELKIIIEFETGYRSDMPIWWYTANSFLYGMVSHSLRLMEVESLVKMGFYICDLHRQIIQMHSEQFGVHNCEDSFKVYRGQGLSKTDFERLSNMHDGLISFNNFLSTSTNRQVALSFAQQPKNNNPDLVAILFVMTIDPSQSTRPFADTKSVSQYSVEQEVLFSMHSIFRIGDIKRLDESRLLFEVNLELTSDTDPDLRTLTDHLRQEICQHPNGWYQLNRLLLKMGQFHTAEQICTDLLKETPDEREKGNLYHQIGLIKTDQGEYEEAITYFEKSLVICEKTLPSKHPHLASSYNNIGSAYNKTNEYLKALAAHEKALAIYQKIRPADHADLASTYNNIGLVHNNMKDYAKALFAHEKALEIRQKALPPYHPDLAWTYNNIGLVYNDRKEYIKALSYHDKALEIRQKALPSNHPDLAMSYNNIGLVYGNLREFAKAVSFHERAVEIGQRSLPSNHPDLTTYNKNLDAAKKRL